MDINILNKDEISFKEIEQAIYKIFCNAAAEFTADLLKTIDDQLFEDRDKSKYRDKGLRKTTIKTVYGEVEYSRHVYLTKDENGKNISVYLLNKELGMDTIGLVSTNLAEKVIEAVTDVPFRKSSELVSKTTGQTISHSGVWNIAQAMGEKLAEEEARLVKEFHAEQTRGTKEIPVLFEEMDGVWLKGQESGGKAPGIEVKMGTMYEGWKSDTGKRSTLAGKTVLASIGKSEVFHEKWEAKIQSIYDPEKIGQRILNGDGGSWIHDEYDAGVLEQLDRFHVIRPVRGKTSHDKARKEMLALLREEKIDDLIEYAEIYYNSICTDEDKPEELLALELKEFLETNKHRLASYKTRLKEMPKAPAGTIYKNMGVQENQNCTVITLRMKGKRKRWAEKSAGNMVRLLYYRENKDLYDAIERCTDGEIWIEPVKNKLKAPLSAAQVGLVDGKGNNRYVDIMNVHLPILDSTSHRTIKVFKRLIY